MADRWQTTLDDVRRRARRLIALRGLAWLAVTFVGLTGLAALTDWAVQLDHPGTRVVLAALVVLVTLFVFVQFLVRPLLVPLSDVAIARLIERHLPECDDQLSSAVQFRQLDAPAEDTSAELREAVIARAEGRLNHVRLDGLFDRRPVWGALTAAALVIGAAFLLSVLHPAETSIALRRLTLPFAGTEWPRTTELTLLTDRLQPVGSRPLVTSTGQTLQLYVEDTLGEPPDDLRLRIRLADGSITSQVLRTTVLRDREGQSHEVGVVRITPHASSLEFRVTGGDDDSMVWQSLEVVPAPAWEELTITVSPPEYSGLPLQTLDGPGLIEGLAGSRVTLQGRANKSLERALLHRDRHRPLSFTLADDGRGLSAEFTIEEPGRAAYWFELTDRDGLSTPDPSRYELRGLADREPVVTIEYPESDLSVTPDARVPLQIVARDDIGLRQLRLVYHAGEGEPAALPLFAASTAAVEHRAVTHWELTPLKLTPGSQVEFFGEAVDGCDVSTPQDQPSGQVGRSPRRRLYVITKDAKRQELAARQSGILGTLDALRERQSRAGERVAELLIQEERTGQLRPQDVDLLKAVELEQRQISEQLTDAPSSARGGVDAIREELSANRLEDPETSSRLDQLADRLDQLRGDWLPRAEQALARARKSTSSPPTIDDVTPNDPADLADPSRQSTAEWLQDAQHAQAAVLDVLQELTSDLEGWRRRFELSSALDILIAEQTTVHQETQEVGRDTLARMLGDLSPQQQADLERLADRQRRLAERLTQLDNAGTPPTSPEAAADLHATADQRELTTAHPQAVSRMHDAAESLRRNEVPQAVAAQEQVLQELRSSFEMLGQSSAQSPEERVQDLQAAAEQLESLRKRQDELIRDAAESMSPSADAQRQERLERLRKHQDELADEVETLAKQLRRRQLDAASRTAARASRNMRDAQDAINRLDPESVDANQQEAAQDLEQAAAEVAQALHDARERLALERLSQLVNTLSDWVERQTSLTDATRELDRQYLERTRWSRPLRRTLQELTQLQQALAAEVRESPRAVDLDPVLTATLDGAAGWMDEAHDALAHEQTGERTQSAQHSAQGRLASILEILTRQSEALLAAPESAPASQSAPPNNAPGLPPIIQLHLLRDWQAEVNRQTTDLSERLADPDPTDDNLAQRLADLDGQQAQITELTRNVLQLLMPSPEPADQEPEQP